MHVREEVAVRHPAAASAVELRRRATVYVISPSRSRKRMNRSRGRAQGQGLDARHPELYTIYNITNDPFQMYCALDRVGWAVCWSFGVKSCCSW